MKFFITILMLSTLAHAQVEEPKAILTCSLSGLTDGPEYILKSNSTLTIQNNAWGLNVILNDAPVKMIGGLLTKTEILTIKGEAPVKTESEEKLVRVSEQSGKYEMLLNISSSISFEGEVMISGKLVKGGMDLGGEILDELNCSVLSQDDFANLGNL